MYIRDINVSFQSGFCLAVALAILYWVSKCIYNLYFHPLRNFPGPKIAAIGCEYEFYHDVVKDGRYLWKMEEMHKKYGQLSRHTAYLLIFFWNIQPLTFDFFHSTGPVVRINADELHISDPNYYNHIYASSRRKVDKWAPMVASYTIPESSVATVDHDLHRLRRSILNPYFSKASVVKLEPIMGERIDRLCQRLEECAQRDEVVSLDSAFSALTTDIITRYFFGSHEDNIGRPGFVHPLQEAILGLTGAFQFTRLFPNVAAVAKNFLPYWVIDLVQPKMANLLRWQDDLLQSIQATVDRDSSSGVVSSSESELKSNTSNRSVILSAFQDPSVPAAQKGIPRLVDEGMLFLIAGSETTARVLSRIMFQLLHDRNLLGRLREELDGLVSRKAGGLTSAVDLESLSLLVGVIPRDAMGRRQSQY
jgi:cytochrome P450